MGPCSDGWLPSARRLPACQEGVNITALHCIRNGKDRQPLQPLHCKYSMQDTSCSHSLTGMNLRILLPAGLEARNELTQLSQPSRRQPPQLPEAVSMETSPNQETKHDAIKYVTHYDLPPSEITKTAKAKHSAPAFPAHCRSPFGLHGNFGLTKSCRTGAPWHRVINLRS